MTMEFDFIVWLQHLGDWLTPLMLFFTTTGDIQVYFVLAAFIYWSVDERLGIRFSLLLACSSWLNACLKQIIRAPRPYWIDARIDAIRASSGFGMPSGHAQVAATAWGWIGATVQRGWAWLCAICIILGIGLSRAYLGVHSPTQVLVGWGFGLLVLWLYWRVEPPLTAWIQQRSTTSLVILTFATSLGMIGVGIPFVFGTDWQLPSLWVKIATRAAPDKLLMPVRFDHIVENAALFAGVALSAILILPSGRFSAQGVWWKRLIRFLIGLIGLVLMLTLTSTINAIGSESTLVTHAVEYLMSLLLALVVFWLLPLLFVKLRLAEERVTQDLHR